MQNLSKTQMASNWGGKGEDLCFRSVVLIAIYAQWVWKYNNAKG